MIPFVQSNWLSQFQTIFALNFLFLPEEYSLKLSWSTEKLRQTEAIIINDIIVCHSSIDHIDLLSRPFYCNISSRSNPLKITLSAFWWALDEAIDDELTRIVTSDGKFVPIKIVPEPSCLSTNTFFRLFGRWSVQLCGLGVKDYRSDTNGAAGASGVAVKFVSPFRPFSFLPILSASFALRRHEKWIHSLHAVAKDSLSRRCCIVHCKFERSPPQPLTFKTVILRKFYTCRRDVLFIALYRIFLPPQ